MPEGETLCLLGDFWGKFTLWCGFDRQTDYLWEEIYGMVLSQIFWKAHHFIQDIELNLTILNSIEFDSAELVHGYPDSVPK